MKLVPGTLNIRLPSNYPLPEKGVIRLEKEEWGGKSSVNIVPCKIRGRKAFIIRTDESEAGQGTHPKEVIEIACDVYLRDLYGLKDGDEIIVEVEA